MSPLAFLLLALVLSVVGITAVWLRHREPDTPDSTIDEFRSKMRALSEQDRDAHQDDGPTGRGDATRRGG